MAVIDTRADDALVDVNAASAQIAELKTLIEKLSFRKGEFELASGRKSDVYFNLKPTMMSSKGAFLTAHALFHTIKDFKFDYAGGLEMGAIPAISSLAALSGGWGRAIETFFVRKKAKQHGTELLVEGLPHGASLSGKRVIIIDDVATSGGSILKAIEAANEDGAVAEAALVIVDRQEGASEKLAEHGVDLLSVFTADDFR